MNVPQSLRVGYLKAGPHDCITDVPGVRVGHTTVIEDAPLVLRTGVTIIHPLPDDAWDANVFAGFHRYNGFGEVTGVQWIEESGVLTSPIALTATFTLGAVRDAVLRYTTRHAKKRRHQIPVVAETNDFFLSDTPAWRISDDHVVAALEGAAGGPVAQGNVGAGTGTTAYLFKGGIGSASRVAATPSGVYTVGVLVQTNHGRREDLAVNGVPVGRMLGVEKVPLPHIGDDDPYLVVPPMLRAVKPQYKEDGSIIIVVATDAPLLPSQCSRLAQRAVVGLGRVGGLGNNSSGDFAICFSTANRFAALPEKTVGAIGMIPNSHSTPLFQATVEATEAAIVNSLLHARTMTGRNGNRASALPLATLLAAVGSAATPSV